jgi:hypothetical protein
MRGNKLSVQILELLAADDRIQLAEAERKSGRPLASYRIFAGGNLATVL